MFKRLLTLTLLFALASQLYAAPAAKAKKPKKGAAPVRTDFTPPGFIYRPVVFLSYVRDIDTHPVVTFSADEDVTAAIWETDAGGKNHVSRAPIFRQSLKKGIKQEVKWQSVTLPNGIYNFHIILTDKVGNSSSYNAPFTIDIINNPNRALILY